MKNMWLGRFTIIKAIYKLAKKAPHVKERGEVKEVYLSLQDSRSGMDSPQ